MPESQSRQGNYVDALKMAKTRASIRIYTFLT